MLKKIINKIIWVLSNLHFFDSWNDEKYLKFIFRIRIGKKLNLKNPQTFNEKLQWLKINDRNPEYTKMVDKYEAKEYVKSVIGEEYVIPTLGIYDSFDEIDFSLLPNAFVLKCTHNSGGVIVVNDKKTIDEVKMKKKITRLLKKNFFYNGREYPYKNIKPRIIIEKNIQENNSKAQINDYKLMCFNGTVKCSFVCSNRNSKTGLCVNFYDREWNPLPFERHYPKNPIEIKKPHNYDKMIVLAEKLSKEIPFVRVDFFEENEKLYFGELTFYPGDGMEEFKPYVWDEKLGNMLDLSKVIIRK